MAGAQPLHHQRREHHRNSACTRPMTMPCLSRLKAEHADSWNLVFVGYLNQRKGMRTSCFPPWRTWSAPDTRGSNSSWSAATNWAVTMSADFIRAARVCENNVVLVGSVHHSQGQALDAFRRCLHPAFAFGRPADRTVRVAVLRHAVHLHPGRRHCRRGCRMANTRLLIAPGSTEAICNAALERLMQDDTAHLRRTPEPAGDMR